MRQTLPLFRNFEVYYLAEANAKECFINIYERGLGLQWETRRAAKIAASYTQSKVIGLLHVKMKRKVYD